MTVQEQATQYAEAFFTFKQERQIPSMNDYGKQKYAYEKFCKDMDKFMADWDAIEQIAVEGKAKFGKSEWYKALDEARWEIGRREFGFNQ